MVEQTVEDPKFARQGAVKAHRCRPPPVDLPPPMAAPTPGSVVVKKYDPKAAAAMKKRVEEDQYLISPSPPARRYPPTRRPSYEGRPAGPKVGGGEGQAAYGQGWRGRCVFAPGQAIESNLKQLAERRSDISRCG